VHEVRVRSPELISLTLASIPRGRQNYEKLVGYVVGWPLHNTVELKRAAARWSRQAYAACDVLYLTTSCVFLAVSTSSLEVGLLKVLKAHLKCSYLTFFNSHGVWQIHMRNAVQFVTVAICYLTWQIVEKNHLIICIVVTNPCWRFK